MAPRGGQRVAACSWHPRPAVAPEADSRSSVPSLEPPDGAAPSAPVGDGRDHVRESPTRREDDHLLRYDVRRTRFRRLYTFAPFRDYRAEASGAQARLQVQ